MIEDRRLLFRTYMERMNPVADPLRAIQAGLCVANPHQTADRIASRLEIDPSSSHLVVGGVGSGKTTELRVAEERLSKIPDLLPLFADIPALEQIDDKREGILILGSARVASEKTLISSASDEAKKIAKSIKERVVGRWVYPDGREYYDDGDDDPGVFVRGRSQPPPSNTEMATLAEDVAKLSRAIGRRIIVLLDGLDRVRRPSDPFVTMIARDAKLLRSHGIGVVVVAPSQLRYGRYKEVIDTFTEFHVHGAIDGSTDEGRVFLDRVLTQRAEESLLPPDTRTEIVRLSGGILRDLISLARTAGDEAYSSGSDRICVDHATRAGDRLGRRLLLGMTEAMAKRLLELRPQYRQGPVLQFTPATDTDIELLIHGVLIEVLGKPVTYHTHPTIESLLPGLRRSA